MSGEEPATQIAPVESPQMVSTIKLPILKKGEYTLWSMRMEQYITNTDYSLWQVILNGDGPIQVIIDENGVETEVPPMTAQALLARQRERKAKSILLLAILDEYQLRFHAIKDAKTLWAAIKSRFSGNVESKKMQKTILKQQFENFSLSDIEGLDKAYDRFQKLISLLEVHGAAVPNEDANQKFLRALPSSWNNVALIMRNKAGIDDLDIDDLYNNIKVLKLISKDDEGRERNGWWSLGLGARAELIMMIWKKMDLKMVIGWPSFYEDNALIVQDGLGYDWSYVAQDEPTEFALMAYTSYSSRSDTELGLQSVEAQLIVHQKNEVVCEEKITVLEFEVKDKSNAITRLKNQLDETLKEKDDLKAKLEQFKRSSKNLNKLINSQLSAKDKTGLGYGDQLNENDSSGSELFNSVFDSRLKVMEMTIKQMIGLDDSVYRPTANKTSASVYQVETSISQTSNTSVEMPRVESVRPSGVIIEDWVSDDEDIFQSNDLQATDKPSFKRIGFTNARNESVKPKQAEKPRMITQNPKVDRRAWTGQMTQKLGLGFGFTKKACFVCGSYSHLIKDFLTRFGRVPVSAAKQSSFRAVASTEVTSPIKALFHKSHSTNTSISNEKVNAVRVNDVNTAGQTAVSVVKGNGVTAGLIPGTMTGNKDFLTDYQDIDGGFVAFGGGTKGATDKNKYSLRVPKQSNMYSFDLRNVVPSGDLTCLFINATIDDSNYGNRSIGLCEFKTMNKFMKGNLVRGLPSKIFVNDNTCVACQKGKKHKASCKTKLVSSINQPLQMLHMDLFGPTIVRSINHKT
ncbi:hypothetical protein Tco_0680970 [Tanacetum coccineum]|uniref:Uncharacterized protein n=1 Tax=Tanacetum coccineum TaxID=301880 RepID=A0ABQ4XNG4_9ASTR